MKYNSNYSEEENARRWRAYANLRETMHPHDTPTEDDKKVLRAVNQTLSDIEAAVRTEITTTYGLLEARKSDPSNSLEDFYISLTLVYGLHKNDPEWDEQEDDNLLYVQTESLHELMDQSAGAVLGSLATDTPWIEWLGQPPCPILAELLAWRGLAWQDLIRIGSIQRSLTVKTDELPCLLHLL